MFQQLGKRLTWKIIKQSHFTAIIDRGVKETAQVLDEILVLFIKGEVKRKDTCYLNIRPDLVNIAGILVDKMIENRKFYSEMLHITFGGR